jgi:aminoglycoside phosphotransferase (APT) family kinase protein
VAEPAPGVAQALEQWLCARGIEAQAEVTGRATVGLSQETWFVRIATGGGSRAAVLRLPTAASGPHAIRTQRVALEAVAGKVPAPALLWHDDGDDNPFSRPFIVMERIAGEVPVGWHEIAEPRRTLLAQAAIDVLSALHAIDPAPLNGPSAAKGRPTEFDWYRRRLERFKPLPAVLEGARWWLDRHAPQRATREVLVHGDYRMGNLIVDDTSIRGVLDWEMAGAGDPMADLAWCFIPVWELPGVSEAPLVVRYAERSGIRVDEERLHWHRVLAYVRLAYYALAGSYAFDSGHSSDFRLAALRLQLPVHLDRLAATIAGEPVT